MSCVLHYCFSWYSPTGQTLHLLNTKARLPVINSVEQCTSWEASSFSASQEILNILWNLKVYFCVHSNLRHCPILINMPLVHDLPSQVFHVVCFLQCSPLKLSFLVSPLRSTCPTHLIIFFLITQYLVNKIWRSWSCNFLHSVASSFLGPNISLSTLFSNTQPVSFH